MKRDRVLIVTPLYPPYPGGASVYFHGLVQHLKENLDVIVLTTSHSRAVESEEGVRVFRTIPNLLESYVPNNIFYRLLRYIVLPTTTFFSAFFIFLRYRPRLIHVHSSTSITLGACFFSFVFRIPLVVDVQDMFPGEFPLNVVIKLGCSPRYVALGKKVEEMLVSINIPEQSILTLLPARPILMKKLDEKPKMDNGGMNILFVGGLTRIKGVDVLLESFRIASSRSEGLAMKIIGDGPMRGFCEEFIAKNDLKIKLLGFLSHNETLELISSSDLVILASRTEAYPRVILEAFEFEKPVIATNVGGIPELLGDGENGILVEPDNPLQLSVAVLKLGEDKDLREKLGKKGKRSLKNFPSWAEVSEKIVGFYGL